MGLNASRLRLLVSACPLTHSASASRPHKRHYSDPDVCKYYLAGFCPHEEFRRTKNDMGDCEGVHDEALKAEWEALDDRCVGASKLN